MSNDLRTLRDLAQLLPPQRPVHCPHLRGRICIELMTSDRQRQGVQRGLEMKDLRDLKDLTIHDVEPIRYELHRASTAFLEQTEIR